jgi:hypothetical protein
MPRNINAKNKVEANRSRTINLEVLPSEADKKKLVLSFGDKGGAEKKARRLNMTRSERKGDSQQPTADAIRFDNTFSAQTNSDKHMHKGLQAADCACAKDAEADQCTTS